MQIQHFLSWNKANIKHSCKSQLYNNKICGILASLIIIKKIAQPLKIYIIL